jgi:hypothetical protein
MDDIRAATEFMLHTGAVYDFPKKLTVAVAGHEKESQLWKDLPYVFHEWRKSLDVEAEELCRCSKPQPYRYE